MPAFELVSLWDMLSLKAEVFYEGISNLRRLQALREKDRPDTALLTEKDKGSIRQHVGALRESLIALDARGALRVADWILADADNPKTTYGKFVDRVHTLDKMVRGELASAKLFALQERDAAFYEPAEPLFGDQVDMMFPSTIFDLEEAGKCLAFGRWTAAAFHSIRVLEVGLRAVARCLGVPDPTKGAERNWGFALKAIQAGIEQRWPKPQDRQKGDGALFESLYASLDAIKNPWRNSTMHVEGKYTEEEALHVFQAIGGFMRRLAARCDEDGDPKA